jgi:hypothetical protein
MDELKYVHAVCCTYVLKSVQVTFLYVTSDKS